MINDSYTVRIKPGKQPEVTRTGEEESEDENEKE